MPFAGLSSQGLSCKWGLTSFLVTSLQYSTSASAEMDVTGMDAGVVADPNWSDRKLVYKSTEYAVVDPGEVQIEFIANPSAVLLANEVGRKRELTFEKSDDEQDPGAFSVTWNAILTQFSTQMQLGEYVRGNCTFKLTEI